MLQPPQNPANAPKFSPNPNSFAPIKPVTPPMEQATIGRTLVIKGEITGGESLYIDGRIEGTINLTDSRVTVGRNGSVAANINAREVVIMGKVTGNIECTDRLDIRGDGSLTGDVVTQRISVEDGAFLKGSVQVRAAEHKHEKAQPTAQSQPKPAEAAKPAAAAAGAGA
ncbi:MAG TPA: polymer-forming cytoskeletal protein [Terriglobales bacterium]|jgi:cytoskeletal protein CcmA (bactofilin family)|nr:polymer-forming cytoskeletal protein [Terriglobales bacterium]